MSFELAAAAREPMAWAWVLLSLGSLATVVSCGNSNGSTTTGSALASGGASTSGLTVTTVGGSPPTSGVVGSGSDSDSVTSVGGSSGVGGASVAEESVSTTGAAVGGAGGGVTSLTTCSFSDDYTVRSQDELDRVAATGCEVVEGTLVLRGSSIVDLSGLATIREIESLSIVLTGLADLDGLGTLTAADTLTITNNEQLSVLELDSLKAVAGRFEIAESAGVIQLPSLESVGEFAIVSNPGLTSVQMDALKSVESFWIQGNESLMTLHDLPSLSYLGDVVSIDGNPMLPQCEVDAILARVGATCLSCSGANNPNGVCN